MTTFQASKVASTVQARGGIDITSVTGEFTVSSNLTTNDIIEMVKIPAGATVLEVIFSSSASVGSTGNLAVGDGGDTDRFITSSAVTAAALLRLNAHTGHGYRYTADDTIDVLAASIATPATGAVLRLTAIYTFQQ